MGFLTSGFQIPFKRFMAVLLLFSPSFTWFYAINAHIFEYRPGTVPPSSDFVLIGKALFFISIALSAIIGSMISKRWKYKRFLGFWIFFGVLITASFAVFEDPTFTLLLSVLAGISFGIGFPSCLAFIADSTAVEERARVSGATMLVTFVLVAIIPGITTQLGFIEGFLALAIFRATSFFALLTETYEVAPVKKKTWADVFNTHGFGLYLLAWLMYMVASSIVVFVESWLPGIPESEMVALESLTLALRYVSTAFAGLLAGFVSDRFGRKYIIAFGLISLGIAYAAYGITTHPMAFLFTQIFFGASFGIMFSIFFMTVIGDLSSQGSRERFYAAGSIFLIGYFTTQLLSEMLSIKTSPNVIASILSLVLFVSVIPVLYSPETLPIEKIRARKLRKYLKKVKEVVEEEETRNHE